MGWSKLEFGNNRVKLALLKDKLTEIQASCPTPDLDTQQRQIKSEIELLLDRDRCTFTNDRGSVG